MRRRGARRRRHRRGSFPLRPRHAEICMPINDRGLQPAKIAVGTGRGIGTDVTCCRTGRKRQGATSYRADKRRLPLMTRDGGRGGDHRRQLLILGDRRGGWNPRDRSRYSESKLFPGQDPFSLRYVLLKRSSVSVEFADYDKRVSSFYGRKLMVVIGSTYVAANMFSEVCYDIDLPPKCKLRTQFMRNCISSQIIEDNLYQFLLHLSAQRIRVAMTSESPNRFDSITDTIRNYSTETEIQRRLDRSSSRSFRIFLRAAVTSMEETGAFQIGCNTLVH